MTHDRKSIADALRQGDRLMYVSGYWALFSSGEPVRKWIVENLLNDPQIRLRPAGDQLPGFPPYCSQTWAFDAVPRPIDG